eukprot:TRINITY_DN27142_c0_g1_i2.p1 TRINITY_DN27142_c0_g1~~TRINITY_DN27142_c0_g1_i2.p1  ORF type:complete len:531 (+),score=56.80 TRINITY_DN27142_c0_g1_i2:100-1593(+)
MPSRGQLLCGGLFAAAAVAAVCIVRPASGAGRSRISVSEVGTRGGAARYSDAPPRDARGAPAPAPQQAPAEPPLGSCAAVLAGRGRTLDALLRRAGASVPAHSGPRPPPLRPAPAPLPSETTTGSTAEGVAQGTARLRNFCVRTEEPFHEVYALLGTGESWGQMAARLHNGSRGQIVESRYKYGLDGKPLRRGSVRVGIALLTPEDIIERTTEVLTWSFPRALNGSTWISDTVYLMTFASGRGNHLLLNLNHMLNRLLPALWVPQEVGAKHILIPWMSVADLTDRQRPRHPGGHILLLEIAAAAAAGFGIGAMLVLETTNHEAITGLKPPSEDACSVLCFRDGAMGQPRWAPSAAVRRAVLRGLRPAQTPPGPRPGGDECERIAADERAQDRFAANPFPTLPHDPVPAEVKAADAPRIRAVIIERGARRRFGPHGLKALREAILSNPATADWNVTVTTPPVEAIGRDAMLAGQMKPFIGADVLIAASGAGAGADTMV